MKNVQLVRIGATTKVELPQLMEPLRKALGIEVVLSSSSLSEPNYAYNKDRKQYHVTAIVRRLAALKTAEEPLVLGVTDLDLFQPEVAAVFGEANRENGAALVSTFRFEASGAGWLSPFLGEAVHQVGHLLGLSICENDSCAMATPMNIGEAIRRSSIICGSCTEELRKIRARIPVF